MDLEQRSKLFLQSLRLRVQKTMQAIERATAVKDQALIEQLSIQLHFQRLHLDDYTHVVIAEGEEIMANDRICANAHRHLTMQSAAMKAVAAGGVAS